MRTVSLHPSRLLLASGGDDCCLKLWYLPSLSEKAVATGAVKKPIAAVAEPGRTLRGHTGPVLCSSIVAHVMCPPPRVGLGNGSAQLCGSLSLSLSLSLSHAHTHTHTDPLSLTHSLSLSLTHTRNHPLSFSLCLSLSFSLTLTLSLCLSLSL